MNEYPGYRQVSVATDVVVFTVREGALYVLLINRPEPPFKEHWALPGGFPKQGHTLEKTITRVLAEKAGVKGIFVEQLFTFDPSGRDPRGDIPTVSYIALVPESRLTSRPSRHQTPSWHPVAKISRLAFDHKTIIQYATERLRSKLEYTNVVYSLLPQAFTLTELQRVYEAVLGRSLDKRNFRKKFLSLGLIRTTGEQTRGGQQRPAQLYTFGEQKPKQLNKFL